MKVTKYSLTQIKSTQAYLGGIIEAAEAPPEAAAAAPPGSGEEAEKRWDDIFQQVKATRRYPKR